MRWKEKLCAAKLVRLIKKLFKPDQKGLRKKHAILTFKEKWFDVTLKDNS